MTRSNDSDSTGAQKRLRGYYAAMDSGDVEAAVAAFSREAVYVRGEKIGVVTPGEPKARCLTASHGRDEIKSFIARQEEAARARGVTIRHRILSVTCAGKRCFVEGVVPTPDGELDVVFFALATFDADGLIERYVAVANESPPHILDHP